MVPINYYHMDPIQLGAHKICMYIQHLASRVMLCVIFSSCEEPDGCVLPVYHHDGKWTLFCEGNNPWNSPEHCAKPGLCP